MKTKITLLFSFLFFILLTVYASSIPFFWDGTFFSELSVHFYENGFNGFVAPANVDTGGFPLFSVYLTFIWKLFGKTLLVSHLAVLPFVIGIAYEYYKLAKRFLSAAILPFAMLLLALEPTLITQTILMGYDILLIYFFLLSLNALLNRQNTIYSIGLAFLFLCSIRGEMVAASHFIIHVYLNFSSKNKWYKSKGNYLLPLFIFICWTVFHGIKTGWFFISPERENTHEALLPAAMMLRQTLFIGWKIMDYGRFALWLFFISGSIMVFKKQQTTALKTLVAFIFIPLLMLSLLMIPIANPIGHKYFMVVFLMLNIGVCFLMEQFSNSIIKRSLQFTFAVVLFMGNYWIYPERYGNGWDSSLKVLPFFQLKKEMDAYIVQQKIAPEQVGTQFPLIADKRFSHLSTTSYSYKNVWSGPINKYPYFLQTNVINTDIPDEIEEVKKNWLPVKTLKSGMVYITLYKNPKN